MGYNFMRFFEDRRDDGVKDHVNCAALHKAGRFTSGDCWTFTIAWGGSQGYCFCFKDMDTPDAKAFTCSSKITQHKHPDPITKVSICGLQS